MINPDVTYFNEHVNVVACCSQAEEFSPARQVAGFPDAAFALAARLLEPDPRARISAAAALQHPFLAAGD